MLRDLGEYERLHNRAPRAWTLSPIHMNRRPISSQQLRYCKRLPANLGPGTYILLLYLPETAMFRVGRLGHSNWLHGYYLYVGSTWGPGGLSSRLRRHWAAAISNHWHIDYFRQKTQLQEIWFQAGGTRSEHTWAKAIGQFMGGVIPMKGFGSSDCSAWHISFIFQIGPRLPPWRTCFSLCRRNGHLFKNYGWVEWNARSPKPRGNCGFNRDCALRDQASPVG
jgi:Uri superfamily endonuclease